MSKGKRNAQLRAAQLIEQNRIAEEQKKLNNVVSQINKILTDNQMTMAVTSLQLVDGKVFPEVRVQPIKAVPQPTQ